MNRNITKKSILMGVVSVVFTGVLCASAEEMDAPEKSSSARQNSADQSADKKPEIIVYNPDKNSEFQILYDKQDRPAQLRISAYSPKKMEVSVVTKNNKKVTTKLDTFSEESQRIIEKWYIINRVISDRGLKVSLDDDVTQRSEETIEGVLYRNSVVVDDSVYCGVDKYETVIYKVSIQNIGKSPLTGARYEYCLYYGKDPENNRGNETLIGDGKLRIVEPRKKVSFETSPVSLYNEVLMTPETYSPEHISVPVKDVRIRKEVFEGELQGIRLRLFLSLPDGSEVMREFSDLSTSDSKYLYWPENNKDKESNEQL